MAVLGVLRILRRQDELVENARRHQRRLAEPHRQGVDVVRIEITPRRHAVKGRLECRLVEFRPEREVIDLQLEIRSVRKSARLALPILEDSREPGVSTILFQEDIHLQRLELGLAQITRLFLLVITRVVRAEKLPRERLVVRPDLLLVGRVELPEILVERRVLDRAFLLPRHYLTSCSSDSERRSVILTRIVPAPSGMSYTPFTNSSFSGMSVTVGVNTEPS